MISANWIEEEFAAAMKKKDKSALIRLWAQLKEWENLLNDSSFEVKKEINKLQEENKEKVVGWDTY